MFVEKNVSNLLDLQSTGVVPTGKGEGLALRVLMEDGKSGTHKLKNLEFKKLRRKEDEDTTTWARNKSELERHGREIIRIFVLLPGSTTATAEQRRTRVKFLEHQQSHKTKTESQTFFTCSVGFFFQHFLLTAGAKILDFSKTSPEEFYQSHLCPSGERTT